MTQCRDGRAAELVFNGHTVFVIANHFASKGGDAPLFGRQQPPTQPSTATRVEQANAVARFVRAISSSDTSAKIVVLGDLNDFEFSAPLAALKATGLVDLVERLPPEDRYTYVLNGNSHVISADIVTSNGVIHVIDTVLLPSVPAAV